MPISVYLLACTSSLSSGLGTILKLSMQMLLHSEGIMTLPWLMLIHSRDIMTLPACLVRTLLMFTY